MELLVKVSADYAYVLQTGRTMLEGNARDLEQDPEVQRIYLGINRAAMSV